MGRSVLFPISVASRLASLFPFQCECVRFDNYILILKDLPRLKMQVGAENLLAFEEAAVKRVPLVTTLLQWAKLIPVYSLTAVFRSL